MTFRTLGVFRADEALVFWGDLALLMFLVFFAPDLAVALEDLSSWSTDFRDDAEVVSFFSLGSTALILVILAIMLLPSKKSLTRLSSGLYHICRAKGKCEIILAVES